MFEKVNPYYHFFNTFEAYNKYTLSVENVSLWESEKKLVTAFAKKNAQILDIGCGAGRTTFGLYKLGFKNIIGIDVSERLLSWALQHNQQMEYGISFFCCDAEKCPFDNNVFDLILFSYNGFTGIPTSERRFRVLREIYRILKNNGIFIFCAHDRNDGDLTFWKHEKERWERGEQDSRLYEFGDRLIPINSKGDYEFLHYYSKEELDNLVNRAGFHILASSRRNEIAIEPENVLNFSADTRFWVLTKKKVG